jgi:nucleotide-binding universal stress UspA family protein
MNAHRHVAPVRDAAITRIAVGVDGFHDGRDAGALGIAIANVTGAELILVAVHSAPILPAPGWDWKSLRKEARRILREMHDSLAPNARMVVETDASVARALQRVTRREHNDLIVLGSSRDTPEGHVRIGRRTRQLLSQFECPIAIAPSGLHAREPIRIERIGVGFDGEPESGRALELAGALATAADAELRVRGVVDERVPVMLRSALGGLVKTEWSDTIAEQQRELHDQAVKAASATGARFTVEIMRGDPPEEVVALSADVDLVVIGSRRWGPAERVLLGSTGEALMHAAACPVLAVARPAGASPDQPPPSEASD